MYILPDPYLCMCMFIRINVYMYVINDRLLKFRLFKYIDNESLNSKYSLLFLK